MKRVHVRFEARRELDDIDVVFRASTKDAQVSSLMSRVGDPLSGMWTAHDVTGTQVTFPEEHIISVSADSKRLKVIAEEGTFWSKMALRDAEGILNPSAFLRISRYEIVNLNKVRRFEFSRAGVLRVEMEDGYETWASRRFIPAIRERLRR
jgi:DNA-binding LytR/AlgR family response regulator